MELHSRGGARRPHKSVSPVAVLLVAAFLVSLLHADWNMKQVAYMNRGTIGSGQVVPFRATAQSPLTLVFLGDFQAGGAGVSFFRYVPLNRYRFVKADTVSDDTGVHAGNLRPWVCGDVDGDSVSELVGANIEFAGNRDRLLTCLYEAPSQGACPDSLAWYGAYDSNPMTYAGEPFYITDLDRDGKREITAMRWQRRRLMVWECVGHDSLRQVSPVDDVVGYSLGIGDFDLDGLTEIATAGSSWNNYVTVFKCTGDDSFELWETTPILLPNGADVFAGTDIDGTHRAVLFASFWSTAGTAWLYQFEPTQGTHGYQPFLVDSASISSGDISGQSKCGDIDGDGVEEIIWSCGTQLQAYRCVGAHQFERVWYWPTLANFVNVNLHDVNGNGYPEVIESGCDQMFRNSTHIFEIEAIRVLSPNRCAWLRPGDTCRIRWQVFSPPRCDSVSLFLRRAPLLNLDTIAHGLSPAETSRLWTVPHIISDSCRIFAIAYGPGWQYDESDTCFRIAPVGVAECPTHETFETGFSSILPNPASSGVGIQFQLRDACRIALSVFDASGRTIARLVDGVQSAGRYATSWSGRDDGGLMLPRGVYFVRLETPSYHEARKLILTE